MRIISGIYKNQTLITPSKYSTFYSKKYKNIAQLTTAARLNKLNNLNKLGKKSITVLSTTANNIASCLRPTQEKVRAAVFSALNSIFLIEKKYKSELPINSLQGAKVLDLCCGIGSFGIEAISRNADFVTFIDADQDSIKITSQNLKKLKIESKHYELIQTNLSNNFRKLLSNLNTHFGTYNVVYIDPPYNNIILTNKILNEITTVDKTINEHNSFDKNIESKQLPNTMIESNQTSNFSITNIVSNRNKYLLSRDCIIIVEISSSQLSRLVLDESKLIILSKKKYSKTIILFLKQTRNF